MGKLIRHELLMNRKIYGSGFAGALTMEYIVHEQTDGNVYGVMPAEGVQEKKQLEIDFVANLGSRRYYIQSAFSIPDKWCSEIRKVSKVPIIFISSASDNMNMVMAMNMGADDFIAKPFDQNVLMAKLQAMLRRTYDFASSVPVLEHRGALLNIGDNTLT